MEEKNSSKEPVHHNYDAMEIEEKASRAQETYVGISSLSKKEEKLRWLEEDI